MGDWTLVESATSSNELTGLTPDTYYEWQVQGILDGGTTEWTAISSFTTDYLPGDVNGVDGVTYADVRAVVESMTNQERDTLSRPQRARQPLLPQHRSALCLARTPFVARRRSRSCAPG